MSNYSGSEGKYIAVGPWGGQSGLRWDDGVYSGVRQIVISTSSSGIHSIQFEYDKNGHSIWSDKHGGNTGTRTDQIKLDYPTQFLVSISGYCGSISEGGSVIVRSFSFETNRKKYGPFGIEKGAPFSLPVNGEIIVGFHGWKSKYLDSIGIYVKPTLQTRPSDMHNKMIPTLSFTDVNRGVIGGGKKVLSLGPWGGDGGKVFDDGINSGVREVHVKRTGGLVSIRVCYDQNGRVVWGNKNGGSGGLKLDKIVFDYPYEVLNHITGYYQSTFLRGPTVIKSLTFHTNKRSYGPFGDQQGFSFSSGSLGPIVGFHGKNGYFVDCLGVHVLETKPFLPHPHPHPFDMSGLKNSEVVWGVPRQDTSLYETGPWGGEGGRPWDDGLHTGVKQIRLTRGDAICSIQFLYVQNDRSVWSTIHGIASNINTYHIKIDYPYEFLTSISGCYDIPKIGDMQRRVIRSLTFYTNKAKYGPYGKAIGTYFSSANREGKVIGFHGRSDTYLDAIGVHMQHWVSDELSRHSNHPERGSIGTLLHNLYK